MGGGVSGYFTNAHSYKKLEGPFATYAINVGLIAKVASIEVSYGDGIYQVSIGPPGSGVGALGSVSAVTTSNKTIVGSKDSCF